jgi:hypothetical protein
MQLLIVSLKVLSRLQFKCLGRNSYIGGLTAGRNSPSALERIRRWAAIHLQPHDVPDEDIGGRGRRPMGLAVRGEKTQPKILVV